MAEPHSLASPISSTMNLPATSNPGKGQKRRSHRLSKPRTNSSSNGNLKPRISLGDLDSLTRSAANSVADLLSPSMDKQAARSTANEPIPQEGGKGSHEDSETRMSGVDGGNSNNELALKSNRIQRTGTMLAKRLSVYKQSAKSTSDLTSVQFELTEDYGWLKEKAQKDRQAMQDHRPSHGAEDAPSKPTPYRRKSLLTPGLATRGNDILRKQADDSHALPKVGPQLQQRYYNPHLSPVSPLTRIASLDNPGRQISLEANRAATPAELDYGLIGGALRIANGGAVSPSLSLATKAESIPPSHAADRLPAPRRVSEREQSSHPLSHAVDEIDDIDRNIYDPYAADAGNPWADHADVADEIADAVAQASRPIEKPLPPSPQPIQEQLQQEDLAVYDDDDEDDEMPSLFDYFSHTPSEARQKVQERESRRNSPRKEVSPASGVRNTTNTANRGEALTFADEPPIMQGPRLGPPTPQHRPSTGEKTLRDSRLEMARVLDNMMAASRYTPLPKQKEEPMWIDEPSSAASDRLSPLWDGTGSSSHTSLNSIAKGGDSSPASSLSHGPDPSERPRASLYGKPLEKFLGVKPEPPPSKYQMPHLPPNLNNKETPALPSPKQTVAVFSAEVVTDQPIQSSPDKKKAKPMANKLQKKQPRPKSMPVPVDRIVVSGHRNASKGNASPIPQPPADMRARVAERWSSRPLEDREPTVPEVDYFTQPQDVKDHNMMQVSPNAPPVPERSTARPRPVTMIQPRSSESFYDSASSAVNADEGGFLPGSTSPSKFRHGDPALLSPAIASSVYSQSQHPRSRAGPGSSGSRPQTSAAYASTDDEDAPIDWAAARRAWAQRRMDAGEGLRMRMERAREDIETNGSLFADTRASWQADANPQIWAQPRAGGREATKTSDKHRSLNYHLPVNHETYASSGPSPLSQPSAAPSPLKQATSPPPSTPGSWAPRAEARHKKNVRSEPTAGSYFPAAAASSVVSGGTGFEGDVDSDHERRAGQQQQQQKKKAANDKAANVGRYESGFAFGYEHGKGVGGSAGTRGVGGQGATRKTGANNLSQGFGVDLSDIPIFVAKSSS